MSAGSTDDATVAGAEGDATDDGADRRPGARRPEGGATGAGTEGAP